MSQPDPARFEMHLLCISCDDFGTFPLACLYAPSLCVRVIRGN